MTRGSAVLRMVRQIAQTYGLLLDIHPPLRELLEEALAHVDEVQNRRAGVRCHPRLVDYRQARINAGDGCPCREIVGKIAGFLARHTQSDLFHDISELSLDSWKRPILQKLARTRHPFVCGNWAKLKFFQRPPKMSMENDDCLTSAIRDATKRCPVKWLFVPLTGHEESEDFPTGLRERRMWVNPSAGSIAQLS